MIRGGLKDKKDDSKLLTIKMVISKPGLGSPSPSTSTQAMWIGLLIEAITHSALYKKIGAIVIGNEIEPALH